MVAGLIMWQNTKTHGNVILLNSGVVVILVHCCTIVRHLSFILLCNLLCFMRNWNYEMIESSNFIRDQRGRRWFISHKSLTLVLNNLKVNEMLFNKRLWVYCRPSIWLVPRVIALTMMHPPSNYMLRIFKHCWTIGLLSNIKWMSTDDLRW